MLRLPISNYRLKSDCGFPITHTLMNAIGGVSTTLYRRGKNDGARFQGLLKDYYPWDREPASTTTPGQAARSIYELFRNPLTHNLGLHLYWSPSPRFKIKRYHRRAGGGVGITERSIERLEDTSKRPAMSNTIVVRPDATVLLVEALYWGVRVMVEHLLCDDLAVRHAESFLQKKGYAALYIGN